MGLWDVYYGRQTWADYISSQAQLEGLEEVLQKRTTDLDAALSKARPGSMKVGLSPKDYQIALESGLGALGATIGYGLGELECSLELGFEQLAGGIDQLNADFNLLLGDIIWKLEMYQEALNNILEEIRLAEFEREARAYRRRAERAYLNGWYEEALGDFLAAEKRNYPDFAVHRSIANICLYHLINLPKALEYFRKAAKYARPSDTRQAAEAHYFAGIVCLLQRQAKAGLVHMQAAVKLNPDLSEAHYQGACLAALLGDGGTAIASLEPAIKGDPRYHERAKGDPVFDGMRPQVQELLDQLMLPVQEKVAEVKHDAELLKGYVIAKPEEERISSIFQSVRQQMAAAKTYPSGLKFLETLSQVQQELKGIYDLFYKQYQIDANDYIRSVAFSPDGRLLASGFLNGGIKVWEVETGLNVLTLKGHLASVNSVVFSPNGQWLASGSRDRNIKLWDVETGQVALTMDGHDSEVRAVTFSPDGQWLASGSHDKTVRMWRVVTGHEIQSLRGHTHHVTSTLFSPDGRLLASGSVDKTIRLWEVATGRTIQTLAGHTRGVASLAFSTDGRWLASGGEDRRIKIWEVATGREIQTLLGHRNDVTSLAFSPDSNLLAAGSLGQIIMVWKLSTGQVIKTLRYNEISYNSVAFSPKGQWLALGSRDLQLWLKVILTEEEYATVKTGEDRALQAKRRAEEQGFTEVLAKQFIDPDWSAESSKYGVCIVCSKKLGFFDKHIFNDRCKKHR